MEMAHLVAKRSTCSRASVGAVIARGFRPLVTGYNGTPAGTDHCSHNENDDEPCWMSVHAEANAIAWAARHGIEVWGATLFVTHLPCIPCSQLIINAGIDQVYYTTPYRDDRGRIMLLTAGVDVIWGTDG